MEVLILIGVILVVAVIWVISATLISKLNEGKSAKRDLEAAWAELCDIKKQCSELKRGYDPKIHKLRHKIEEQGGIIHKLKRDIRQNQETLEAAIELRQNQETLEAAMQRCEAALEQKDLLYAQLQNKNNEPLEYISSLMADHLTLQYDISAKYLASKKRPAKEEARRIGWLKKRTKEIVKKSKLLEYRLEYLFQLFPDLELYVDDLQSIAELGKLDHLGELEERTDRTRYYLSGDEYDALPEDDRNQLALDRYIASRKSKWQIGRDYELSVGYEYSKNGWNVEYFGIDRQLEDMGRDLIATKNNEIHIIQCKYWSQKKLIHEKHIAQLYGTTVQFILSSPQKCNVTPVLVTSISLSDTANSFAEYLNVKVIDNKQMSDFPRIKCNINRDECGTKTRIYHLPMDQQYDRTKICNEGEFFAFTVQEAVDAGFRRACRWFGNG